MKVRAIDVTSDRGMLITSSTKVQIIAYDRANSTLCFSFMGNQTYGHVHMPPETVLSVVSKEYALWYVGNKFDTICSQLIREKYGGLKIGRYTSILAYMVKSQALRSGRTFEGITSRI